MTKKIALFLSFLFIFTQNLIASDKAISTFRNKAPKAQSLSGNATQSNLANQPTYTPKSINNLPGATFNGTSSFLNYDGTNLTDSSYTIFIVEQRASNKANNYFLGTTSTSPAANQGLILGYKDNNTILFGQGTNEETIAIEPYSGKNPIIHIFVHDKNGGKKYYRNGSLLLNKSSNTTSLVGNDNATIGRSGNNYFDGKIAEMALYKRALTDLEIKDIQNYMIDKWKISRMDPVVTGCSPTSLGYVSSPNIQWSNGGSAISGGSVSATCINGTTMVGTISNLSCLNSVYTGGSGGTCSDLSCANPNLAIPLQNGTWSTTSVNHNQTITGTCNPGTTQSPSGTISASCLNSSYTNLTNTDSCKLNCTTASPGYVTISNGFWSGGGNANHNASVTASCNSGYIMSGTMSNLTCNNGSWSGGSGGTCLPDTCTTSSSGYISPVANGSWSASTASHGSSITKVCNSGYIASGALNTLTCNYGTWTSSNSSGTCTLGATCSNPTGFSGANIANGTWSSTTNVASGATITFSCNASNPYTGLTTDNSFTSGYTKSGTINNLLCTNGSWSWVGGSSGGGSCAVSSCPNFNGSSGLNLAETPISTCAPFYYSVSGEWFWNRCCANGKWYHSHAGQRTGSVPGGASKFVNHTATIVTNNSSMPASCSGTSLCP